MKDFISGKGTFVVLTTVFRKSVVYGVLLLWLIIYWASIAIIVYTNVMMLQDAKDV